MYVIRSLPAILRGALLALAAAGSGVAVAGPLSAYLGVDYDSNPGNAGSKDDVRPAALLQAGLAGEWQVNSGPNSAFQFRGGVDADGYKGASSEEHNGDKATLEDLSEARAALRVRWLYRPGSGFFTPLLSAWISGGGRASGSELRSSSDYRAGAFVREQLSTALESRLGYTWARREAPDSRVFDQTGGTANLEFDLRVSPGSTLYLDLQHYRGDIAASILGPLAPKTEHLYLGPLAEAIEPDEAWGDGWYALKLRASGNSLTLGWNFALTPSWALDIGGQYGQTQVDDAPKSYKRGQLAVTLLKRF